MTVSDPPKKARAAHDPDEYRMSIGDHLEELRHRIFLGLAGIIVALVICTPFAKHLLTVICLPMTRALAANHLTPQLVTNEATEVFMAWVQVSLITAASLAGPWLVYQLWQFIAAGLYPKERKAVTKYIPLAMVLLMTGMAFVYFIVLPLTMHFFVSFATSFPMSGTAGTVPDPAPTFVQALAGDPVSPKPYEMWFNTVQQRLKIFADGTVSNITYSSDSLFATHFNLTDYLDLVFRLLITFGLCFQLPLVVLALAKLGIVEVAQLRAWRRYVYFAMTVLAAAVSPGDVVTATMALLIPLIFLYELGILMAKMSASKAEEGGDEGVTQ